MSVLDQLVTEGHCPAPPTALRMVSLADFIEWEARRRKLWDCDPALQRIFSRALHSWVEALPAPPPGVPVTSVGYRPSEPAAVAETREAAE